MVYLYVVDIYYGIFDDDRNSINKIECCLLAFHILNNTFSPPICNHKSIDIFFSEMKVYSYTRTNTHTHPGKLIIKVYRPLLPYLAAAVMSRGKGCSTEHRSMLKVG